MDVTPIVVWLVIWGVMIFASTPIGIVTGLTVGFFTGLIWDEEDTGGAVGTALGWIAGAVLAIFSIIQVILHIIALVQATT